MTTVTDAVKSAGPAAKNWNGFYDQDTKTVHVILEQFLRPGGGGTRNAGMTALHEVGHAFDDILKVSQSPAFQQAHAADVEKLRGKKMTESLRSKLRYDDYPHDAARRAEVFAEAVAVQYGEGRRTPAAEWVNSTQFRRTWTSSIEVVRRQLESVQ